MSMPSLFIRGWYEGISHAASCITLRHIFRYNFIFKELAFIKMIVFFNYSVGCGSQNQDIFLQNLNWRYCMEKSYI